MTTAPPSLHTRGELRAAGIGPRSVREELRANLLARLRGSEPLFPGILGYDETVIPALENALLSGHDFIFLGDTAFGETVAKVAERPGWDSLSAVADGRVVELDSDIAGRWGPRTVALVEAIAGALLGDTG